MSAENDVLTTTVQNVYFSCVCAGPVSKDPSPQDPSFPPGEDVDRRAGLQRTGPVAQDGEQACEWRLLHCGIFFSFVSLAVGCCRRRN